MFITVKNYIINTNSIVKINYDGHFLYFSLTYDTISMFFDSEEECIKTFNRIGKQLANSKKLNETL